MRSRARRTLTGVTAALTVAGVTGALVVGGPGAAPPARAEELAAFSGCEELRRWYADAAAPLITSYGLAGRPEHVATAASTQAAAVGATRVAAATDAVGPGATGTNVQEPGVDEPDLAKTDGRRLVTVTAGRLHVLDTGGGRPRLLGSLDLGRRGPAELLLVGNRALVLGTAHDAGDPAERGFDPLPRPGTDRRLSSPGPGTGPPATTLTVVDLSDPARPRTVAAEDVDGGYLSARERDGVVRVVVTSTPRLRFRYPTGSGRDPRDPTTERGALAANRRLVSGATAQQWLPRRTVRDATGRVVRREPLLDCTAVRRPARAAGLATLSVLTLDLRAGDGLSARDVAAVAADGQMVYASSDRLYVATTEGGWAAWGGDGGDAVALPLPRGARAGGPSTRLHAFDTAARTRTGYLASGGVEGHLLGRWAMSEHQGMLRVAATREPRTPEGRSESGVAVLAERGDRLVPVGSVDGLGRGEQIRAVRWFGDLATVVTFRQTDPLYTVDLSDPRRPRVRGALKIPGYSAYLHPVGGGLLLGVGQDATPTGQVTGVQVSAFDLRDLARPRRVGQVGLGAGHTLVEGDSRAFTYLPARRLAVLPVSGARGVGIAAVAVGSDGGVREAGRVTLAREVQRVVPLAGGRLAVVGYGEVTLVDERLRRLGRLRLG